MKYEESITAGEGWESEAKKLMEKGISFVVVGWDHSWENEHSQAFAGEFNYAMLFDPKTVRAFFSPKHTTQDTI